MGFDTKTKHSFDVKVSPIMVFLKRISPGMLMRNTLRHMSVTCTLPRRRISFKEKVIHCMFIGTIILATPVIFFANLKHLKPSKSEEEQEH